MGQLPQIWSKIWAEPDMGGLAEKDLLQLEPKSGTSLNIMHSSTLIPAQKNKHVFVRSPGG